MKFTSFEHRVLTAIIARDSEYDTLRDQLATASVQSREYTGVGLFTNISVSADSPRLKTASRFIEDVPKLHLMHPSVAHGAGAILWITEGLISTLECYTYDGLWPSSEDEFQIVTT